jgi:hypothetical protein
MGITIHSYPRALQRRAAHRRKTTINNNTYYKFQRNKRTQSSCLKSQQQEENNKKHDDLEQHLDSLQERIYMTRQYIRAIRYEYTGASREAVDHYVTVIDGMYRRIATYYINNIRDDLPILDTFLAQIEDEYTDLITEGGFTESEAYDYIYGHDCCPDAPNCSEEEGEEDAPCTAASADADDAAVAAFNALVIT